MGAQDSFAFAEDFELRMQELELLVGDARG